VQHLANLLWAFATLELHPGRRMMDAVVEVLPAVWKTFFTCMLSTSVGLERLGHHAVLISFQCSLLAGHPAQDCMLKPLKRASHVSE